MSSSIDENLSIGEAQSLARAREVELDVHSESDGTWSLAAMRSGVLVAHSASTSLLHALVLLLARIDAHDATVPRSPRLPREASDYLPTLPARGDA